MSTTNFSGEYNGGVGLFLKGREGEIRWNRQVTSISDVAFICGSQPRVRGGESVDARVEKIAEDVAIIS